jgi:pimeloyl-ACP methyl ester carboxylesterase
MKRLAATAAALALTVAGLATAQTATAEPDGGRGGPHHPKAYTPPPIQWSGCADETLAAIGAQCGMVTVPLSYAHPRGRKIQLAISRLPHTSSAKDYQGAILVNPGGPGGSGLLFSFLGFPGIIPGDVSGDYDWIGWDPRGVGASTPSLSCDGQYTGYDRPNYVPTSPDVESTWLQRSKGYAEDCKNADGAVLLRHVKTKDTVADMESIRRALRQKKLNLYGFSYGTYLGQVYASRHPHKVRRFVLDSNVDPRGIWYQDNLVQNRAFETAIEAFFGWLAEHDDVYGLGTDPQVIEKQYYAELDALDANPAAGGTIGPDELADVLLTAGYVVFAWEDIGDAYARAINDDDYSVIKEMFDDANPQTDGSDNGYAMYLATGCTDARWPKSWTRWHNDSVRIAAEAPFVTWGNTWFNAPCAFWPAKAGHPVRVKGGKVTRPILLIGETLDAATPFSGSLEVRRRFPRSSLIEGVGGTTHAGSLSGVACTDNAVAAYFRTGAVPHRTRGNHSDKKCPPVPQPNPMPAPALSGRSPAPSSAADDVIRRAIAAANQWR